MSLVSQNSVTWAALLLLILGKNTGDSILPLGEALVVLSVAKSSLTV